MALLLYLSIFSFKKKNQMFKRKKKQKGNVPLNNLLRNANHSRQTNVKKARPFNKQAVQRHDDRVKASQTRNYNRRIMLFGLT